MLERINFLETVGEVISDKHFDNCLTAVVSCIYMDSCGQIIS